MFLLQYEIPVCFTQCVHGNNWKPEEAQFEVAYVSNVFLTTNNEYSKYKHLLFIKHPFFLGTKKNICSGSDEC